MIIKFLFALEHNIFWCDFYCLFILVVVEAKGKCCPQNAPVVGQALSLLNCILPKVDWVPCNKFWHLNRNIIAKNS